MSDITPDGDSVPSRRSVLTGIAGSASLGAAGLAAGASSESPSERRERLESERTIEQEYENADLRAILAERTVDVREDLVADGVLNSADVSQFDLDVESARATEPANFVAVRDAVGFTVSYDEEAGTATAHLFAAAETDSGEVHLHVEPEVDEVETHTFVEPTAVAGAATAALQSSDCEKCTVACDHDVYGDIVFGVTPPTDCNDTDWECTREATCSECDCGGW